MSSREVTLIREASRSLMARGGLVYLPQLTVDAETDAVVLFVGFEVNVRGARMNGVHQDFLQKLDDGRIVDIGGFLGRGRCLLGQQRDIQTIAHELIELLCGGATQFFDQPQQLVVFDHHGVDRRLRMEFDPIDGLQVGRVGQQHGEPAASLGHGHDPALGEQACIDQIAGNRRWLQRLQIKQGQAKGFGGKLRESGRRKIGQLHDFVDKPRARGVCLFLDGDRLLEAQHLLLHQCAGESGQHGAGGSSRTDS